ncbi:nucleolar and coiled-body phosphoprotein 1-like isoform X1 [Trichogramma pretiosum]|uniref:nucleolar and coiled-body phosphoprotein 1-like isoform X1 n=1 Tax=Trichogramma pretiosum TaxID=7493 RepID=UPI0006C94186|nr:nucleolar and coiled-body phosphoprotein 1-like isoform X1 [Trichogramma pretiosum]
MRASTIRNLSLLCCLVVFVCGTSSEKVCNCEHCRCAANAATSSAGASAGVGGGAVVQVSNLPPPAATKVAYVADEVLSSFPTCKDCGEYHHHQQHHHQPRPRSNNDHSSAQIYRQEAARRVSEPCRCQLKVGNGNELRTTIRLEPAQQQEAVTKIVLPKSSSPKSEQISSVSVVPSNVARMAKKKELLKKESETTLKPVVIDFEQLQKLLTSGSLTNNNNAASDKDKRMPTPIILYVVAAPNAITLEKSKPIEAAKGMSEPISEPATTTKARANNDSEPLRMTQLAGRTSTQGFAKKFRRSPNLRQRRLDESTRASSTAVPTAIKASKISLKTTTTTTTTTSAPPQRSPPRPLGQWLRGLRQLAESSTTVPSESSSSDVVTERSKRWIKNPTNGHAAPVRPPPPARSPAASKKVPKKTFRRINGSEQQPRQQQQQPLEGPDTRLTLSSLEKSFTAAAVAKKKKTASLKKRLSPQLAQKSAKQEEPVAAAPKSPSKPASSSASKLASDDSSTSDSLDTSDLQQRRYKLVRRHLSSRGQNNDYWIMRIPKRNESTFATVIADAANFVAKLFSNGRRSYDRD